MFRSFCLVFFCSFFSLTGLAGPAAILTSMSCGEFSLPVSISERSLSYQGQCLDTQRFRSASIQVDDKDKIVFDNFLHNDTYWTVSLSKTAKVKEVAIQVVRFEVVSGVIAGHTQYKVQLDKGSSFELTDKDGNKETVDNLVVSFEAARPKDVSYNFAAGMVDNYILVGRVASNTQRLKEYGEGYTTENYILNLPEDERLEILLSGIRASQERGYGTFYNTLKPNCTTEIFDLFDKLPSVAARNPKPFLTMLSNDPVVKPTIDGMIARGMFAGCGPDMKMDPKTGAFEFSEISPETCIERQNPILADIPFMAVVENMPYSVILASDLPEDAKLAKKVEGAAYSLAPILLQRVGASVMLGRDNSAASLLTALKALGPALDKTITDLEDSLGDKKATVALYLAPWDNTARDDVAFTKIEDTMDELGVPAVLPFSTFRLVEGVGGPQATWEFRDSLAAAAKAHRDKKAPFGVLGLVAQLHIDRAEGSKVTLQLAGYASPQEKALEVTNDLVVISKMVVPEALNDFSLPVALITLGYKKGQKVPTLALDFGSLSGTVPRAGIVSDRAGNLSVASGADIGVYAIQREDCVDRAFNVPYLHGGAAILEAIDVKLKVFAVDFDLENQSASNVEVRTDAAYGLIKSCERDENVNKQFTDSVNEKIDEEKGKALVKAEEKSSPGLAILQELLAE